MKKFNKLFEEKKLKYEKRHGLESFGNTGNTNGKKEKTSITMDEYNKMKLTESGSSLDLCLE